MEFKKGDIVELNNIGVDYYKKTYSKHDYIINNTLIIDKQLVGNSYSCIFTKTELFIWISGRYLQLDKNHYRKEKLKQLKNGI